MLSKNYSINSFLSDTNLTKEDATKNNFLEKKWNTILSLQKKVNDLQEEIKNLKLELDKAGSLGSTNGFIKKENESMVNKI